MRGNRIILWCLILALLAACARVPVAASPMPTQPAAEAPASPSAGPLASATLPATLTPSPAPTATPEPSPTLTPAKRAPVIVISFDGASAEWVNRWMAAGQLPTFERLAAQGLRAERMYTVDPPLTAAAHASMVSGAYPGRTGIVSNQFHNPADSFYWYRSGFEEPIDAVDPLWVNASRAGLVTAALFVAGGTPFLPAQTADYTIAYGQQLSYSKLETLSLTKTAKAWQGEAPTSYSPVMAGEWLIPKVAAVYLWAIDSLDDGQIAYDTLLLNHERSFSQALALQVGVWGALEVDPERAAGAHFLLRQMTPEGNGLAVTLYHSGVNQNTAAPRSLLEALNAEYGFFPAGADSYALEHGWITPEEFLQMLTRSANWIADVTAWVYDQYQPDLLFTWFDTFDTAGHEFFLPPETGRNDPALEQKRQAFEQAAHIADEALAQVLSAIPPEENNVFVVSDHGMAAIQQTVNLNTILEQNGYLVLDNKDYVVVKRSKAIAFASGGTAHIYLNLAGRDKDGFLSAEQYHQVLEDLRQLLANLKDPQTGDPVFERLLLREDLAQYHLEHPNAGDLVLQAYPGYNLDSHRGWKDIFQPANFNGQHGFAASQPAMDAIWIAAGPGLARHCLLADPGTILPSVHIVDLVPTLAVLLEINLPEPVDGAPLNGMCP